MNNCVSVRRDQLESIHRVGFPSSAPPSSVLMHGAGRPIQDLKSSRLARCDTSAMADQGSYVLGHSQGELRRLESQARVVDPITRRFVEEAGIGPGMRVLDVGTGAGDVAFLLADVVGSGGEVVGFDRSEVGVAT